MCLPDCLNALRPTFPLRLERLIGGVCGGVTPLGPPPWRETLPRDVGGRRESPSSSNSRRSRDPTGTLQRFSLYSFTHSQTISTVYPRGRTTTSYHSNDRPSPKPCLYLHRELTPRPFLYLPKRLQRMGRTTITTNITLVWIEKLERCLIINVHPCPPMKGGMGVGV